jgi:hypothetical protein
VSPIPLIERQRALSRIGEIRCGDEKQDGKVGRKLDTFRLTSQHREILDRAAELYGGTVKEWASPAGAAWQLITERSVLPVLVIPGYSLRRSYEKWDGPSKRVRLCDGEDEALSGQPCICNAQGKDECKILTRLMVLLPETGTSLGWQLSSTGDTAADELALAMKIAEGLAGGNPFLPAKVRLTQRRGQLNGQATRFVVPVLEFDPVQRQLAAGEVPERALPQGYTPIDAPPSNGVSLEQGLQVAETQELKRGPRSAAPIPQVDEIPFGEGPVPVAVESDAAVGEVAVSGSAPSLGEPERAASEPSKPLTLAEAKKKMNALVGQLREGGHITTAQLYQRMASERGLEVDHMIALIEGARDDKGELHWAPLRDTLSRDEANALHGRLARLWVNVQDDGA